MLTMDFTPKVLHIAVNLAVTVTKRPRSTFNEGLIYYPTHIYSGLNTLSQDYFEEFFLAGRRFKVNCISTEMGPGELAGVFQDHFSSFESSFGIGGTLATFTIEPANLEKFWSEIESAPQRFFKSAEKKIWADKPIPGLVIKA